MAFSRRPRLRSLPIPAKRRGFVKKNGRTCAASRLAGPIQAQIQVLNHIPYMEVHVNPPFQLLSCSTLIILVDFHPFRLNYSIQ